MRSLRVKRRSKRQAPPELKLEPRCQTSVLGLGAWGGRPQVLPPRRRPKRRVGCAGLRRSVVQLDDEAVRFEVPVRHGGTREGALCEAGERRCAPSVAA
jgi:hypothetical protein